MSERPLHWIGIDVAKETFEAGLGFAGQRPTTETFRCVPVKSFLRTPEGVAELLAWVDEQLTSRPEAFHLRAVMEATSFYSLELCAWLNQARPELAPAIADPAQTHAYVKSLKLRNKTDRTDARALSFYGVERHPKPYEALSEEHQQLRELVRYRDVLITEKVAEGNRTEQEPANKALRSIQQQRRKQLERNIERVEKEIKNLLRRSPNLQRDYKLLTSIPGVAFVTAIVILSEMGDLRRFTRARQATAYAGVTPRRVESGTSVNKKTKMSKKGNPRVRKALYMAAMTTIRTSPELRRIYDKIKQRSGKGAVALGVIMRKLVTIMRALLITETPFEACGKLGGKQRRCTT